MKNTSSQTSLSYCGALVKDTDFDRFLLSLFLPAGIREDVWAVLAYNHEISKTREVVSESTLGLIRLQWWRDAIQAIYEQDKVLEHEVLKPLAFAIRRHDLPREAFDRLAYAREFDLEDVMPSNLEGLMNYADFTTNPLMALIVKITGENPEDFVIQPVAINYALAGLIRAIPSLLRQNRFLLPEDFFQKHQLNKDIILKKEGRERLMALVEDICRCKLPKTKPSHPFLKGCEILSDMYFKQIARAGYDVFSQKVQNEPAFKVLRLSACMKMPG